MHIEDRDPLDRLQEAARGHRHTRTWPRVQAIILAKQGDTAAQTARALGVSRRAVQAWAAACNRGGLGALPDRPHLGRTPILPRDQQARFLERIEAPPRPDDGVCELRGADIRWILEQEFAARYTLDGVYKLLHRLGYSDLMPRPCHPEADPEAQAFFKEIVVEQIAAIAEQHPDARVEVWHQDEARFGQKGSLTRVWARRGSRPRRVRQDGRESLYVLTAVCAASGEAVGLVMPELNTEVVNLFLEEFSRRLAPGGSSRATCRRKPLSTAVSSPETSMAETDPVATQTAAIAYSEVRPGGRTARGRDPRRAQTRVSVPCWPNRASSSNQTWSS